VIAETANRETEIKTEKEKQYEIEKCVKMKINKKVRRRGFETAEASDMNFDLVDVL